MKICVLLLTGRTHDSSCFHISSSAKRANFLLACQMTAHFFFASYADCERFQKARPPDSQLSSDVFSSLGDKLELRKEPLTLITVSGEEREDSSQCLPDCSEPVSPSHKYSDVGTLEGGRRGQKRRTEQPLWRGTAVVMWQPGRQ